MINNDPSLTLPRHSQSLNISSNSFKWNQIDGTLFTTNLNIVYDKIVYWKKNLFLLPTGAIGKAYIQEVTRLIFA